jgi:hypothetical protein
MDWRQVSPATLEERLIYWTIVGTWGLWLLGALYVVGPLLGYTLVAIVIGRWLGLIGAHQTADVRIPRVPSSGSSACWQCCWRSSSVMPIKSSDWIRP